MDWSNLEDGLGLQRIKMGADDKDRGYLLQRRRAVQIGVGALALVTLGGLLLLTSNYAMRAEQTKVISARHDIRAKEHEGILDMATMGAELEAHLMHEGRESFVERQFLNKEEDYEDELLRKMQRGLDGSFGSFMAATTADPYLASLAPAERASLLTLLGRQNRELHAVVLGEIRSFSGRMDALARAHLREVTAESEAARARLKELHEMLKAGISAEVRLEEKEEAGKAAAAAGVGGVGGGVGGGGAAGAGAGGGAAVAAPAVGAEAAAAAAAGGAGPPAAADGGDAALRKRLRRFFAKAEAHAAAGRAKGVALPPAAYAALEALLEKASSGHNTDAVEAAVLVQLAADKEAADKEAAARHAAAPSGGSRGSAGLKLLYGAPAYDGEGIALYLEALLFDSRFNAKLLGELRELRSRWEAGGLGGVPLLGLLMEQVQHGVPSEWLVNVNSAT
jgi:hypothetical protein